MCETLGNGPARRDHYHVYHTSFHYYVIYVNHLVSKVITIYGQSYGFQGHPYDSRSTIDSTYPLLLLFRQLILYPVFSMPFVIILTDVYCVRVA